MIEPRILEGDISAENAILILENLRGRARFYDGTYSYMGKEYCELLAGIDQAAIDKAISALQNQG